MLLLVGLGNPGSKYERTRHNIGFMAVDAIADAHGFSDDRKQFQGLIREGRIGTEKTIILKPQTFMNESGRSVGEAVRFYKLDIDDVVVFHDELDLAPGKVRVKRGGGHAGHNGLRSMHAHIGESYRRVRLGIGHPGNKAKVSGYVLHDFAKADADWMDPLLAGIPKYVPALVDAEDSRFQSDLAQFIQNSGEGQNSGERQNSGEEAKPKARAAAKEKAQETKALDAKGSGAAPNDPAPASPFAALKSLLTARGDTK